MWSNIRIGFTQVFSNSQYNLLVVLGAVLMYVLTVLIHKSDFIWYVVTGSNFDMFTKLSLIGNSFVSIQTNFATTGALVLTIVLSLLVGINIAMLVYHLRRRIAAQSAAGLSVLGIVSSVIGVGCASCGSVVLSSFLSIGVTAGLITWLPLKGAEFSIIALGLLIFSIYLLSKKIATPLLCAVKTE